MNNIINEFTILPDQHKITVVSCSTGNTLKVYKGFDSAPFITVELKETDIESLIYILQKTLLIIKENG